MKQVVFVLLVVGMLSSCGNKRSDKKYYYAIDSVLSEQALLLAGAKATLTKEATLDSEKETKSYAPKDSAAWAYEFDAFAELNDINKPANVGKYHVEQGLRDINSNLLIYAIESTEKLPVVFMKVYYLDNPSNIRRIEGLYYEQSSLLKGSQSSLLKSSRKVVMEFQNINNKIVLTSYSITGGQKMLLGDTVQYSVNGLVTLP